MVWLLKSGAGRVGCFQVIIFIFMFLLVLSIPYCAGFLISELTNIFDFNFLMAALWSVALTLNIFSIRWLYKSHVQLGKVCRNPIFHRFNGTVQLYLGKGQHLHAPFEELIPYQTRAARTGENNYGYESRLYVFHPETNESFYLLEKTIDEHDINWWIELEIVWALLSHYMDTSRPLPDIPDFEPFRQLDPTTQAFDVQTKRPDYLWFNMSNMKYLDRVETVQKTILEYVDQEGINSASVSNMMRATPYR